MKEDLLLFNILNKVIEIYYSVGGGLGNKSFDFSEALLIVPNYLNTKILINYLFYFSKIDII
jgi:hypothetical protein